MTSGMQIVRGAVDAECLTVIRERVFAEMFSLASLAEPGIFKLQRGVRLSTIDSTEIKVLAAYLNVMTGLQCDLSKSSARYQEPDGECQLRWHQDAAPMQLQANEAGVVAWVPLDPIDGTRPSLEIADPEPCRDHGEDERWFLVIKDAEFHGTTLENLALGDIVLMSPYAPHRTFIDPSMTQPRMSLDMRFYDPNRASI